MLLALPRWFRIRRVLRAAAGTMRAGYEPTKVTVRVRRTQATFEVRSSLFCRVREAQAAPLCDFHAALIVQLLNRFSLPAAVQIEQCTGTQGGHCAVVIDVGMAE